MTTDKELLELAAKAAGYAVDYYIGAHAKDDGSMRLGFFLPKGGHVTWNPLCSNDAALRLAVDLRLRVEVNDASILVQWVVDECEGHQLYEYPDSEQGPDYEIVHKNHAAATCRAIVRAAAEIGRRMP